MTLGYSSLNAKQSVNKQSKTHPPKELKMNIAKNMEAIFVAAIVVASATTFATAAVPAARVAAPATAVVAKADTAKMQVVTISAKRLTAAEKAAL
jgi:hypothetical protein